MTTVEPLDPSISELPNYSAVVDPSRPITRDVPVFAQALAADGIRLRLQDATICISGNDGRVCGLDTMSVERLPAELIAVGIGVIPNVELAAEAGLDVENGEKTDQALLTSDPAIFAVDDCACFPNPSMGVPTRLESVQNATDHARTVAARMLGKPVRYETVPWF